MGSQIPAAVLASGAPLGTPCRAGIQGVRSACVVVAFVLGPIKILETAESSLSLWWDHPKLVNILSVLCLRHDLDRAVTGGYSPRESCTARMVAISEWPTQCRWSPISEKSQLWQSVPLRVPHILSPASTPRDLRSPTHLEVTGFPSVTVLAQQWVHSFI